MIRECDKTGTGQFYFIELCMHQQPGQIPGWPIGLEILGCEILVFTLLSFCLFSKVVAVKVTVLSLSQYYHSNLDVTLITPVKFSTLPTLLLQVIFPFMILLFFLGLLPLEIKCKERTMQEKENLHNRQIWISQMVHDKDKCQ